MVEKKHITTEEIKDEQLVIKTIEKGKEYYFYIPRERKRSLTLAEQQELTQKVMSTVKQASKEKLKPGVIITTIRDIVTCTDSWLIRATAFASAIALLLCILGGLVLVVSAISDSGWAKAAIEFSGLNPDNWSVTKTITGHIQYIRSKEAFIISQS